MCTHSDNSLQPTLGEYASASKGLMSMKSDSESVTRSADAPCKEASPVTAADPLPSELAAGLQQHLEQEGSEASWCSCTEEPSPLAEAEAEATPHVLDALHDDRPADPCFAAATHVPDTPHDGHPTADDPACPASCNPVNGQEVGEEQHQQEPREEGGEQWQEVKEGGAQQQQNQEELLKRADELKAEGNKLYGEGKFEEAAAKYNEAIATGRPSLSRMVVIGFRMSTIGFRDEHDRV